MERFFEDFDKMWNLITEGKNFAYARYADGEVLLMKGMSVGHATQAFSIDKWSSPNSLTRVGGELFQTLYHVEDNYFYAISGKNDNISDYNYLIENIKQNSEYITFANLWINANYQRMFSNFNTIKRDVVLICNEKAKKENFPFNVIDITPFPNDCIEFWEKNADEYIDMLLKTYGDFKDKLFLISCGPVSEIIIDRLYKNNPNNTYMDVGSSIDEFVHGAKTRPFMNPATSYSKSKSIF